MLTAVLVLHSHSIFHRDIKPQNILVGYDQIGLRACLSDFGLAKRLSPLMLKASARGTMGFKAPETFPDMTNDSCAGDVWALGVTLYLLLTDGFPFSRENIDQLNQKSFEQPMLPANHFNIQVDRDLEQILNRALAINPDDRYQNAKKLLEALNLWKPRSIENPDSTKPNLSEGKTKNVLGMLSPVNEEHARVMIDHAYQVSLQPHKLQEAADIMEEAFNKLPDLRDEYEDQLLCWRRGKMM